VVFKGKGGGGRSDGRSGQPTRRIVSPDPAGGYRVDAPGAKRASAKAPTQAKAEKRAKEIVKNLGGGEVTVRRQSGGRFRDSDTVKPGNDPNPPKDKKH
jgi:hypothetical protein